MITSTEPVGADVFLRPTDPHPVTIVNRRSAGRFLFTCDHASNRLPAGLGDMGLTAEQLSSHIAWDPGALPVAEALAEAFDSPVVLGEYSRLVVDLNRPPESPGSMPISSAGVSIPGNIGLRESDRAQRLDALFHPYHDAIDRLLSERNGSAQPTCLVAIHSFTPDYPGEARPWHVGVIHRRDLGLGGALVNALREMDGILVGDNLPFQIHDDGDVTIPRHGEQRHLPNVLIEIRQDMLRTPSDRSSWASLLRAALDRAAGLLPRRP